MIIIKKFFVSLPLKQAGSRGSYLELPQLRESKFLYTRRTLHTFRSEWEPYTCFHGEKENDPLIVTKNTP